MNVVIDRSIIGQTVCYLERSMVSDKMVCHKHKVTGYMVDKDEDGIGARVRLDNGKWIKPKDLFYPEEEGLARKHLEEKLNKKVN
ncbi:MAG: hypothetical protein K2N23_00290 [Clostridia bacterium]|nr:hypothetical protein [Clostridia bacterium]